MWPSRSRRSSAAKRCRTWWIARPATDMSGYMQAACSIIPPTNQSEAMAERKTRVAILFGGRSAEHDVSRASAANVLRSLDLNRYEVALIGITRHGRWIVAD